MISTDKRLLTIGHSAMIRIKLLSLLTGAKELTGQGCDKTCESSPSHLHISAEDRRDGKPCHVASFSAMLELADSDSFCRAVFKEEGYGFIENDIRHKG